MFPKIKMCFIFAAMEEKLNSIVDQSTQLFMRFGIRSLTMDDVAKNLHISKKTLYQFVSDKDDLVNKCIEGACETDCTAIQQIQALQLNAIDELLEISKFVSQRLGNIHPSIFFDLEKYHPGAMGRFDKHKQEFIFACINRNLQKGLEEGHYRKDMNPEIVAKLYLSIIDSVLHRAGFHHSDYSIADIYQEVITYHLHAIVSEKGLQHLNQIKNQATT